MSDSLWSMDRSPPGSSVHRISQATLLKWVAFPFSRGSSRPRDRTWVSCITRRFFTVWATRGAQISFAYTGTPEKAMAPHSSTLAWKILWMEEPGRLQCMGSLQVGHNWAISFSCIGEWNGNPLQCSCLENPRDGGAWWAAVYGLAQSDTTEVT